MTQEITQLAEENQRALEGYYKFHSKVYDMSRWSFLFGREKIIDLINPATPPARILEIGCGTGKNLVPLLQKFPQATAVGLDLSADMLAVAQRTLSRFGDRVSFLQQRYDDPLHQAGQDKFDLILFSYSLTMINPGWDKVIESAVADLAPGGLIAAVDFHDSRFDGFKRWMGVNHVRMDGHLLPKLESELTPQLSSVKQAYVGVWEYLLFVGSKS